MVKILVVIILLALLLIAGCKASDKGLGVSTQTFKQSYSELGFNFIKVSDNKIIGLSSKKDIELELLGEQNVEKVILTIKGNAKKLESSGCTISIKLLFYNLSSNSDELFTKTTGFFKLSDRFSSLKMRFNERNIKYELLHRSRSFKNNRQSYLKIIALQK